MRNDIAKQLPDQPQIPGRLLSIGERSGDLYSSDVMTFASTGATTREHEHRYAWAYKPPYPFIFDRIASPIGIGALKIDYRYWAERTFFDRPEPVGITRTSHPAKIRFNSSIATLDLTGRALAVELPDVDKADAVSQYGSAEKWRQLNIEVLKSLIMLDLEMEVAALFQTQSNFATNYYGTLEAGDFAAHKYWSDTAATPMATMLGAIEGKIGSSGKLYGMADTLIVGADVNYNLRTQVSEIKSAVSITASQRDSARPVLGENAIQNYFDVPNYIVGRARYNSTPEDSTVTMSDIWAKYAVMCQTGGAQLGTNMSPAFARIAYLDSQAVPNYQGWSVRSVRDEMMGGIGGEILVVCYWAMPVIFSQKLGWNLKVLA